MEIKYQRKKVHYEIKKSFVVSSLWAVSLRKMNTFLFFGFFLLQRNDFYILTCYFFYFPLSLSQHNGSWHLIYLLLISFLFCKSCLLSQTSLHDWCAKSKFMMFTHETWGCWFQKVLCCCSSTFSNPIVGDIGQARKIYSWMGSSSFELHSCFLMCLGNLF